MSTPKSTVGQIVEALESAGFSVSTPQFDRENGQPVPARSPLTAVDWVALRTLSEAELAALGCGRWGKKEEPNGRESGPMLMLFPWEWYEHIPEGFAIVTISFECERFERGVTDDDKRYGMLSFGILAHEGSVQS